MTTLIDLQPGTVFAKDFKIERPLSEGGMGAVYVVEQVSTGKRRALKVMHPRLVADARSRERFAQEARIGAQIDSENVVEVVAAGVDESSGTPWLAMELLEGQDLDQALKQRGRFAPGEAREVMDQLCDALGRAHNRGIIHRDLKPENIFLAVPRRRGVPFVVKILDFGIARMVQDSEAGATATSAIGSPLWMAPEQGGVGTKHRPATDVWALGLITFKLLTGKSFWSAANEPPESFNLQALFVEVMVNPIPQASARAFELGCPGILPEGFDAWFARCVDREPPARFANATATFAALAPLLDAMTGTPSPVGYLPTQALPAVSVPVVNNSAPQTASSTPSPTSPIATGVAMGEPMPSRPRGKGLVIGIGLATVVALGAAAGVYAVNGHSPNPSPTPTPTPTVVSDAGSAPLAQDAGMMMPPESPAARHREDELAAERERQRERERDHPTPVAPGYQAPNLDTMNEQQLGQYAAMLRQAGNAPAARQAMTAYLQRFPGGPRTVPFRRYLQNHP